MSLVRLSQVHDGQHHEYECLKRNDQDVEAGPHHTQQQLANGATDTGERSDRETAAEHGQQQEDHFAGVEISVQAQSQRDRACQMLDEVQQQVERHHPLAERMREQLPGEAAETLDLEAVEHDDQEHGDRHAERDLQIGGRNDLEMFDTDLLADQREQVHRHGVHEIHQQDPAEDRERQRRDDLAGAVEGVSHLGVDELHHRLDEALEAARNTVGAELAGGQVERNDEQQAEQHREEDAVDVDGPESFTVLKIRQVVNDVFAARGSVFSGVFGCGHLLFFLALHGGGAAGAGFSSQGRQRVRQCDPVNK